MSDSSKYLDLLRDASGHRVWSLVVTIFGDLAQDPGASISGPLLSRFASAARIKPEALRVALHRLRKDGWLQSSRSGRYSLYSLTEEGRRQSAWATPRIYNAERHGADQWYLAIGDASILAPAGDVQINAHTVLGMGAAPEFGDRVLSVTGQTRRVPHWVCEMICPPPLSQDLRDLSQKLARLEGLAPAPAGPLEVAVLRVLVVHGWRRLLLRMPDVPDDIFPPEWPGHQCREQVAALLGRWPRPRLDQLEA